MSHIITLCHHNLQDKAVSFMKISIEIRLFLKKQATVNRDKITVDMEMVFFLPLHFLGGYRASNEKLPPKLLFFSVPKIKGSFCLSFTCKM